MAVASPSLCWLRSPGGPDGARRFKTPGLRHSAAVGVPVIPDTDFDDLSVDVVRSLAAWLMNQDSWPCRIARIPRTPSAPAGNLRRAAHELRVENLLLIERAELGLGPGLNVLTGETGAGKTVLAHALDLLLGGKPRAGIVRPGASEAYVEGVFALPALRAARRPPARGRGRARAGAPRERRGPHARVPRRPQRYGGRPGGDRRRAALLLRPARAPEADAGGAQLEILDGFCGPEQAARREAFAAAYARERALREELEALRARAGARDRELDLLEWELEEIDRADPSEAEEESLLAERERLRHVTALLGAAGGAAAALTGDDAGGEGAAAALAAAAHVLEATRGVDPALDTLADRAQALAVEATTWPASCAGTGRRSRPRPAGSTRSRSGSRCSTG